MISVKDLMLKANNYRKKIIQMVYYAQAGHPGGALSVIDILTAIYYTDIDFESEERSKLVLSKGHCVPAQYAILHDLGFISDNEIKEYRQVNSRLEGHPYTLSVPQVDATTGLLGQGLSIGVGMALGKSYKESNKRVYVILGDGEMHEGQNWEAIMQAAHYKLNNLIAVIDYNKLSSSGLVDDVINISSLEEKFKAFDWDVIQIDGHNMQNILNALGKAKNSSMPSLIIAHTVKGKGINFMENNPKWHSGKLTTRQYEEALSQLESIGGIIEYEM